MFAIINIIIVIITGKSHARAWSWLQVAASHFSNSSGGTHFTVQGLSSRLLFNGVLLVFSIRPQVSPLPPAMLLGDHPLGEVLATWLNKYHWLKRVISPEKHWLLIVFVDQIAVPLLNSVPYLFLNSSKFLLRYIHFQQQQNSLYFLFVLRQI